MPLALSPGFEPWTEQQLFRLWLYFSSFVVSKNPATSAALVRVPFPSQFSSEKGLVSVCLVLVLLKNKQTKAMHKTNKRTNRLMLLDATEACHWVKLTDQVPLEKKINLFFTHLFYRRRKRRSERRTRRKARKRKWRDGHLIVIRI